MPVKSPRFSFDEAVPAPSGAEIASNATDIYINQFMFSGGPRNGSYPNPDDVLRYESRGRYYELYDQMEFTDPHFASVLETRKNAILGKKWSILEAENDPRGSEISEFVNLSIKNIPQFKAGLFELLDSMSKGWKAIEIMWDNQVIAGLSDGGLKAVVREFKGRPQRRFVFSIKNELMLLSPDEQTSQGISISSVPLGTPVPKNKFIVAQFCVKNDNPYGTGLGHKCYWYYWFKKALIKYGMIFADKFGMPTAVGKYKRGQGNEEVEKLKQILATIQQETTLTIPDDVIIELLEAQRTGTSQIYENFIAMFDDAISKAVLGQTLTASEGRRSGSLALGEVHADVRQDWLEKDAEWLEEILNAQLIRPMVDFNYVNVVEYPRIKFDVQRNENLAERATVYSTLKNMGVDLSKEQIRDEFKLEEPSDAADTIKGGFEQAGFGGGGFGSNAGGSSGTPPKKTSRSKSPAKQGGSTPPQEGGTQKFSEQDDALDEMITSAIGGGINAHAPVRTGIRALVEKKNLRAARESVDKTVEKSLRDFQNQIERNLFRAFSTGRSEIRRKVPGLTEFAEEVTPEQIGRLLTEGARSIARDQQAHIVRVTKAALTDAINAGDTQGDFLKRINDILSSAGITPSNPGRIVTVYETSLATAYNAGRMSEMIDLENELPWWIYITRDDARVRPNHQKLHRFVAAANSAVWNKIYPPNGFRCRCLVDGLTQAEFKILKGYKLVIPPGGGPDPGFNKNPIDYLRSL